MTKLYYTPPDNEIFEEVKAAAIKIWQGYDNTHGYVDEKVGRIKDLKNVGDNFMFMVAMFDPVNQRKLMASLSKDAKEASNERLIAGGGVEIGSDYELDMQTKQDVLAVGLRTGKGKYEWRGA